MPKVNEELTVSSQLGSRIAARFVNVGLTEPLLELRGQSFAPEVVNWLDAQPAKATTKDQVNVSGA